MNKFNNISNTDLQHIIEEWIKNERDRGIMKRRLIDGITIEKLAEEYDLSVKQVHRLTMKYSEYLYSLCTEWATISI